MIKMNKKHRENGGNELERKRATTQNRQWDQRMRMRSAIEMTLRTTLMRIWHSLSPRATKTILDCRTSWSGWPPATKSSLSRNRGPFKACQTSHRSSALALLKSQRLTCYNISKILVKDNL